MAEYQNTFLGANLEFPNLGVHFLLAEIVKFRKQLTVRQEFKSQSGWNDGLNRYMVTELEKLADTLENITYNPDSFSLEELEAQAGDTSRSLNEDYNEYALTQDNVLMPVGVNRTLSWDLTGADVDMPQLSPQNCPNDYARTFVAALDNFFVELTRLDSRHQPYAITKYESVMMRSLLNVLYTLTQRKGGEVNRSDIPTGTLPSDEVSTFRAGRA
tara:strand:+ start:36032 stop:36676 length:645 start_codon:yes stop_codon:yes gene_type:complete